MLRGLFNGASLLLWFTALSMVPLGDATALSLLGPLFVAMGAMFMAKKCMARDGWRWLSVSRCSRDCRPGFQQIDLGMMLVIVSMLFVTCSKLIAKSLSRTDQPSTIVAYLSLTMMVPSGSGAFLCLADAHADAASLNGRHWVYGKLRSLLLTTAYKIADISAVEPVVFARLVWAAIVGWFMFAEFPGLWIWIGGALIVAASTWLAQHESRERRRKEKAA